VQVYFLELLCVNWSIGEIFDVVAQKAGLSELARDRSLPDFRLDFSKVHFISSILHRKYMSLRHYSNSAFVYRVKALRIDVLPLEQVPRWRSRLSLDLLSGEA
jgi:hypothetical protein